MLTRAQVLKRFGLPARKIFSIKPEKDQYGVWRVAFTSEGTSTVRMLPSAAMLLADELRTRDPALAVRIEDCAKQAQHYVKPPI